ncbi:hypothetical protein ACOSQ4_017820 [Xanthoceras sorbifolium]
MDGRLKIFEDLAFLAANGGGGRGWASHSHNGEGRSMEISIGYVELDLHHPSRSMMIKIFDLSQTHSKPALTPTTTAVNPNFIFSSRTDHPPQPNFILSSPAQTIHTSVFTHQRRRPPAQSSSTASLRPDQTARISKASLRRPRLPSSRSVRSALFRLPLQVLQYHGRGPSISVFDALDHVVLAMESNFKIMTLIFVTLRLVEFSTTDVLY